MSVLGHILSVTFPFFGLVLCGYAVARRGWVGLEAIPGLNFYVLYLALPAMLLRFAATTPIASLLSPGIVLTYVLCALCMLAITLALTRRRVGNWNDAAFGALVAAFPNSGFMGVPLLVALLGASSAGPAIVSIVVDLLVTSSLCIALSRLDGADKHGAGQAGRQALKGVMVNPMPWAIVLGAVTSALQMTWPAPVDKIGRAHV